MPMNSTREPGGRTVKCLDGRFHGGTECVGIEVSIAGQKRRQVEHEGRITRGRASPDRLGRRGTAQQQQAERPLFQFGPKRRGPDSRGGPRQGGPAHRPGASAARAAAAPSSHAAGKVTRRGGESGSAPISMRRVRVPCQIR